MGVNQLAANLLIPVLDFIPFTGWVLSAYSSMVLKYPGRERDTGGVFLSWVSVTGIRKGSNRWLRSHDGSHLITGV